MQSPFRRRRHPRIVRNLLLPFPRVCLHITIPHCIGHELPWSRNRLRWHQSLIRQINWRVRDRTQPRNNVCSRIGWSASRSKFFRTGGVANGRQNGAIVPCLFSLRRTSCKPSRWLLLLLLWAREVVLWHGGLWLNDFRFELESWELTFQVCVGLWRLEHLKRSWFSVSFSRQTNRIRNFVMTNLKKKKKKCKFYFNFWVKKEKRILMEVMKRSGKLELF